MKNLNKKITSIFLSLIIILSVTPFAFAQHDNEKNKYIFDVELLCSYFDKNSVVLRINASENLNNCFGKLILTDETTGKVISVFYDGYSHNDEAPNTDNRGFSDLSFSFSYEFSETSNYSVILPADSFYSDLCETYSIPFPEEDIVFYFDGQKLFSEDFNPFFVSVFSDYKSFGFYGNPQSEMYYYIDFEKDKNQTLKINVLVPPSWDNELSLYSSYDGTFKAKKEISFYSSTVTINHHDGCIYFAIFDKQSGMYYDDMYIRAKSLRNNAPESFEELLGDTVYELITIISTPFVSGLISLFGLLMLPLSSVALLEGIIGLFV